MREILNYKECKRCEIQGIYYQSSNDTCWITAKPSQAKSQIPILLLLGAASRNNNESNTHSIIYFARFASRSARSYNGLR